MEDNSNKTQELTPDSSLNESFEHENKNSIKHSGFGIRKRLRSGYNKRFGSIISGSSKSEQEDLAPSPVVTTSSPNYFGKIGKNVSSHLSDKTPTKDTLPELSIENSTNTSLYILRRNNSRQNSRSNSLVNSLYLNNLNNGSIAGANNISNNLHLNTNSNSGHNTPKMGPETPSMMTPTIGYSHKFQNSVSSFSSVDFDINNNNGGQCTPTPTTTNFPSYFQAPIDLTNDFINIFKQEYENYCLNPKVTPFDHNNPPPGVIEIIFKKSKWHIKVQKLYICKNNKNQLSLDTNNNLYNTLKHILTENSYTSRRNVSRTNSVTSFQLDMNYPLKYSTSNLDNNLNLEMQQQTVFTQPDGSFSTCLYKVNDIIMGNENEHPNDNKIESDKPQLNAINSANSVPSNPILFSPRKLKREESIETHKMDSFDNLHIMEKKESELSSIVSLEEIKDGSRGLETSTEPQFVLEQAPKIEKKRN